MKRKLVTVGIMLMIALMLPFSTYGQINVKTLKFEDIEQQARSHSQAISNNWSSYINASKGVNDGLAGIDLLIQQWDQANDSLDGVDLGDYETVFAYLLGVQYNSLMQQKVSLESQNTSDMATQIQMANDTIIWSMETLYINYNSLNAQLNDLIAKENLMKSQLKIVQLQEQLGMVTRITVEEVEGQLSQLSTSIQQLRESTNSIKNQLNVSLAQEYDTDLEVGGVPSVTDEDIKDIDPDFDIVSALVWSYNVRLNDSNSDKEADEKRKFRNNFYRTYQTILDKQQLLRAEEITFVTAEKKLSFAELKHKMGLISSMQLETERSSYISQKAALEVAQNNLFQAYHAYQWAKEGLIVSSGSSGAGM